MNTTISVAKGDGIGAEIMNTVINIFDAANVPVTYEFVEMGKEYFEKGYSAGMTENAKEVIEKNGVLFKGPMETPKGKGMKSINVTARKVWNTYANKRVFRSLAGVDTVFSKAGIPINITIVRENIEDTYGGIEHMLTHDVALCRRFITRPGSIQVHKYTFEMARKKGAKRVTCGHKANIMKITDGLFLETFYEVAKQYPEIKADDVIVDDLAMKLVVKPHDFDVVVLPNLQGDIISDLCAGLVGGLGFAPSANIGDNISIFEAVHGTAPDISGLGVANPTALLLSGIMMLRHINLDTYADTIENALLYTLEMGAHTADFGNATTKPLATTDFADAIIKNFGQQPKQSPLAKTIAKQQDFKAPQIPVQNKILETELQQNQINGVDFFIESNEQPNVVADKFLKNLDRNLYSLTTMSNRGTQVWPTGSVFTECINQYRVRVESIENRPMEQQEVLDISNKIIKDFKLCSLELLMIYDGKKAYSLAQGQ